MIIALPFIGKVGISGRLRVTLRDAKTGIIKADYWNGNKVVDVGLNLVRDLLGNANYEPSHIAVGTDNTAPVAGDTTLGTEVFRNAITLTDIDPQKVTFQLFLDAGDANGNELKEAAVFSNMATDGGPMLSRVILSPTIDKDAETTATLSWEITFSRGASTNITDAGLTYLAKLLAGTELAPIYAAVGDDNTAWSASDTALGNEVYREEIARRKDDSKRISFQMDIAAGDASGYVLREAGLFNAASGGTMLTRVLTSPVIDKVTSPAATAVLTWKYDIAEA